MVLNALTRRWFQRHSPDPQLSQVLRAWEQAGRPAPPPHEYKQQIVREYAARFGTGVFVETGTYLGDMIEAMRKEFRQLYSIELGVDLWKQATQRFAQFGHIRLYQGDSSAVLSDVIKAIQEPCLFWLDGHYSAGITAKGSMATPIVRELEIIFAHSIREHVVLIDDARLFVGKDDYPTVAELRNLLAASKPDWHLHVQDDIIRLHRNQ